MHSPRRAMGAREGDGIGDAHAIRGAYSGGGGPQPVDPGPQVQSSPPSPCFLLPRTRTSGRREVADDGGLAGRVRPARLPRGGTARAPRGSICAAHSICRCLLRCIGR